MTAAGAPWRQEPEEARTWLPDTWRHHAAPGPREVETTAYCLLAYNTIGRVTEGRDLLLWLQRQQNALGGFRSTQVDK